MTFTSSLRKTLAAGALAATGFGLLAPIASAVPSPNTFPLETHKVRINGGNADFGNGFHGGVISAGKGSVKFMLETSNTEADSITAEVRGRAYWDSATATGCTKVRVDYFDSSGRRIERDESDPVCRVGGFDLAQGVPSKYLNEAASDPAIRTVQISTRKAASANNTFRHVRGSTETVRLRTPVGTLGQGSVRVGEFERDLKVPSAKLSALVLHDVQTRNAPTADRATARVTGTLKYTGWGEGCAEVIARYRNANNQTIETDRSTVCQNIWGDDVSIFSLRSASSADLDSVKLTLKSTRNGVSSEASRVISLD